MNRISLNLIISVLLCSSAFCQDYKIAATNKDGYTTVYHTTYIKAESYYQTSSSITRYGLINSADKIILPLQYESIYTAYEDGIYIVKDTMKQTGLYAAVAGKFIVEPQYYEIESFSEGLAIVKKQKQPYGFLWGAVDTKGNVVIPVEYDYLGSVHEGLMNFSLNNKSGFIDRSNKVIIPAMYTNLSNFGNGLAPVHTAEELKYGYIDKNNTMVIPAKYEAAADFFEGYAAVKRKVGVSVRGSKKTDDETALINNKGKELTGYDYNYISLHMDGGVFIVTKNDKKGVIDSTGKLLLPVEYKEANSFEGHIIYRTTGNKSGMINFKGLTLLKPEYDYISNIGQGKMYTYLNGQYTVLDKNLKVIIPADSAELVKTTKERILYIANDHVKIFNRNGKLLRTNQQGNIKTYSGVLTADEDSLKIEYDGIVQLIDLTTNIKRSLPYNETGGFNDEGIFIARKVKNDFYDYTGKKLNRRSFYAVVNFSEGICALQDSGNAKTYIADKNFAKIKELDYVFQGPFSEGVALTKDNTNVAYIDKKGNTLFTIKASDGGKCKEGRILLKNSYGDYFHVDKKGKQVGPNIWRQAGEFNEGIAAVKELDKWGFVDSLGNVIIPTKYEGVSSFSEGVAVVKLNSEYFLINKKGEPVNTEKYESAGNPSNGTFPLMKNKKVGLVNSKGIAIIDFKYQSITTMEEGRCWAMKDGKWALIDDKGKELTGFIYKATGSFINGYAVVNVNDKFGLVDKTGKLVLPATYSSVGSVYKNTVLAIIPPGTKTYSLK